MASTSALVRVVGEPVGNLVLGHRTFSHAKHACQFPIRQCQPKEVRTNRRVIDLLGCSLLLTTLNPHPIDIHRIRLAAVISESKYNGEFAAGFLPMRMCYVISPKRIKGRRGKGFRHYDLIMWITAVQ